MKLDTKLKKQQCKKEASEKALYEHLEENISILMETIPSETLLRNGRVSLSFTPDKSLIDNLSLYTYNVAGFIRTSVTKICEKYKSRTVSIKSSYNICDGKVTLVVLLEGKI